MNGEMKNRPPKWTVGTRTPEGVRYEIAMIDCMIMPGSVTASRLGPQSAPVTLRVTAIDSGDG
jgi:hypothetical protein